MKTRSELRAEREKQARETGEESPSNRFDERPEAGSRPDAANPEPPIPAPVAVPFQFRSANKERLHRVRADLAQVVEVVFVEDIFGSWKRLSEALRIGEKRSDHGTLIRALDEAEENALLAHRLFVTAKIAREKWERENDTIFGAMWSAATASLQSEKDKGARTKQITDADVKNRVATLYPDQYEEQETRRAEVKGTVEVLEDLAEQWKSRCRTLQAMLAKMR